MKVKGKKLVEENLRKYFGDLLKVFILKIIIVFSTLEVTFISGMYVDSLTADCMEIESIIKYTILFIIFIFLEIIFSYGFSIIFCKTQANIVFSINYDTLKYIKKTKLSFLSGKNPVYLNQRINEDSNAVVDFLLNVVCDLIVSIFTLAWIVFAVFKIEWKLAITIILSCPIYVWIYLQFEKELNVETYNYKEYRNRFIASMNKQLENPRFIKMNSLFNHLNKELKRKYLTFFRILCGYCKCNYKYSSMMDTIGKSYDIFLFIYCAVGIYNHTVTVGDFLIVRGYYTLLLQAVTQVINVFKTYPNMKISLGRLYGIFNETQEHNGKIKLNTINKIKLKNFSFSYGTVCVFRNFNYDFNKGKIYLICGENGKGKTTLINNLLGLYIDEFSGEIYYNEKNIKQINMYELRKHKIAVTEQEPTLLYSNLMKYIKDFYKKNNSEVLDALMRGFNINFEYRENCSGGEKQKISLIWSLLKKSELLILDEPTSALDRMSTEYLLEILQKIKRKKIIIIISHDKCFVEIADQVINLDLLKENEVKF